MLYLICGVSLEGAFWNNFFAATGEYFYHANFKSPRWLKYFVQTPELHSVHHELDVHRYNFGDLPIWDHLFGTYKDAPAFATQCGIPRNNERSSSTCCSFATSTTATTVRLGTRPDHASAIGQEACSTNGSRRPFRTAR